ncbi:MULTISPECIES: hypothetical protein [unclassified Streptomyces]|uniref:hypothetical protein n=1 Tax=unclassified Streptomyces TaxID=2593676 RepID=UPI0007472FA2|nr:MULTISPECIES: hypothetical protein [unclassified Streptomyces]KUL54478.1 hypothetical protein ADL30_15520 [Streptomyces sp. NRRL S-1521]THC53293.1 hypothetical protein E7X58_08580 [Streptomyces sp. A1499]
MTDPVSRTILLLDIEKFSDRDDVEQAYLRRMLYDIADRALAKAGVEETLRLRADRGDSVMELVDANASVTALLRALLTEVPMELRAVNRMASSTAQIRLRAVLASGYVAIDERNGWVGSDLNHACRLLDGDVLRRALRERVDDFALCVSQSVYEGIVRHDRPGVPSDAFHAVTVDSKNGPLRAWLHGPVPGAPTSHHGTGEGGAPAPDGTGDAAPAPEPRGPRPAPGAPTAATGAVFDFGGGSPCFGGSLVAGDQHGVSGGLVAGDVNLGGATPGGARPPRADRGERR